MVDHGFRFPFALTALGQLSSMLLGEAGVAGRAGEGGSAFACREAGIAGLHLRLAACSVPTLLGPLPLPLLQPGPPRCWAWRRCDRRPRPARPSPACSPSPSALRPRSFWATIPTWGCRVRAVPVAGQRGRGARCPGAWWRPRRCAICKLKPGRLQEPTPAPAVAFINMLKAATPLVTLAVGLAARLERLSKLTLLATALIAFGTAVATASEAATGECREGCIIRKERLLGGLWACDGQASTSRSCLACALVQATSAGSPLWPLPSASCSRACAWCSRRSCWGRCVCVGVRPCESGSSEVCIACFCCTRLSSLHPPSAPLEHTYTPPSPRRPSTTSWRRSCTWAPSPPPSWPAARTSSSGTRGCPQRCAWPRCEGGPGLLGPQNPLGSCLPLPPHLLLTLLHVPGSPGAGLGGAPVVRGPVCDGPHAQLPGQPFLLPLHQARLSYQLQGCRCVQGGRQAFSRRLAVCGAHAGGEAVPSRAGSNAASSGVFLTSCRAAGLRAGCLKNVIVVWGGILQGDKVSERELQASGPCVLVCRDAARRAGCARRRQFAHGWCSPPLQGYAISLGGFVLFSFARMRRPAGAEHGSSPHRKRR